MITLRQIAQAIRQNGIKQARNGAYINLESQNGSFTDHMGSLFFSREENEIASACAMGQAGINLQINPEKIHFALDERFDYLGQNIMTMNDEEEMSFEEIATYIETEYADRLNEAVIY